MKRRTVFLAFLLLAIEGLAVSVTDDQAKSVARAFVARGQLMGEYFGGTVEKSDRYTTDNGAAFYFVKMQGTGTIITTGDTDLDPIIAFVPGGDDLSALDARHPLWALLKGDIAVRQEMLQVASTLPLASAGVARLASAARGNRGKWETLLSEDESRPVATTLLCGAKVPSIEIMNESNIRVAKLVETTWSQSGKGENYYTPPGEPGDSGNYVCGCVATAMAQLMRYHRYPTAEVPKFSQLCTVDGKSVLKESLGGAFDWENMPAARGSTEVEKRAIGKLTYDCGVAVGMSWSDGLSTATMDGVAESLKSRFGYANVEYAYDSSSGLSMAGENLGRIILSSLDAGSPVNLGIDNNGADGHAIVGDGYGFVDSLAYVHLNMGWGGSGDAWYHLPDIDYRSTLGGSLYTANTIHACVYNVFPEGTGRVLSGRVLNDEGEPLAGASVRIFPSGASEPVTNLTTSAHGVWAALLPVGTYSVTATSPEGMRTGEIASITLGNTANIWGRDIEVSDPSVRVGEQVYPSLDAALAAATEGCTIEVLKPTELRRSRAIDVSCTILALAEDATESAVLLKSGAQLTVSNDVRVLFRNIVFTNAIDSVTINVATGGTAAVSGLVGVDGFVTADATGFELAGETFESYTLDCAKAKATGEAFGTYSCDEGVAAQCAVRIENVYDEYGEIRGAAEAGKLVWREVPVPLSEAAGYFVDASGNTNTAARIDRAFEKFEAAANAGSLGAHPQLRLLKSGTLSRQLTVGGEASIVGEGAELTLAGNGADAGFIVTNGTLVVSNLCFTGFSGNALLLVAGGAAEVAGCAFENIAGTNRYSGALTVLKGSAVVRNSVFADCRATGVYTPQGNTCAAYGGAAYVSTGSGLTLLDTTITNCQANTHGGGVYAETNVVVRLGGSTWVTNNFHKFSTSAVADDIFVRQTSRLAVTDLPPMVEIVAPIPADRPQIGLRSNYTAAMAPGVEFARVAEGVRFEGNEYVHTLKSFYCDFDDTPLAAAAYSAAVSNRIVWVEQSGDRRVESGAVWQVSNCREGVDGGYLSLADALSAVDGPAEIEMVGAFGKDTFSADLQVIHPIVLTGGRLERDGDCSIQVSATGALTLNETVLAGWKGEQPKFYRQPLVSVGGGLLTLENGAEVCNVRGEGARDSSAIVVWNGGEFTLNPNTRIENCCNLTSNEVYGVDGAGGALMVENSVAYLRGGEIVNCQSRLGNGVFIGSSSRACVSGKFKLTEGAGAEGSLVYSNNSIIDMDAKFTGEVHVREAAGTDPMEFGVVTWSGADITEMRNAATNFVHWSDGVRGTVVTNAEGALLVWQSAVIHDVGYTDGRGRTFYTAFPAGKTLATPRAFSTSLSTAADGAVELKCDNSVEGCWYSVYSTESLDQPFVKECEIQLKAGESFKFQSENSTGTRFFKVVAEEGLK